MNVRAIYLAGTASTCLNALKRLGYEVLGLFPSILPFIVLRGTLGGLLYFIRKNSPDSRLIKCTVVLRSLSCSLLGWTFWRLCIVARKERSLWACNSRVDVRSPSSQERADCIWLWYATLLFCELVELVCPRRRVFKMMSLKTRDTGMLEGLHQSEHSQPASTSSSEDVQEHQGGEPEEEQEVEQTQPCRRVTSSSHHTSSSACDAPAAEVDEADSEESEAALENLLVSIGPAAETDGRFRGLRAELQRRRQRRAQANHAATDSLSAQSGVEGHCSTPVQRGEQQESCCRLDFKMVGRHQQREGQDGLGDQSWQVKEIQLWSTSWLRRVAGFWLKSWEGCQQCWTYLANMEPAKLARVCLGGGDDHREHWVYIGTTPSILLLVVLLTQGWTAGDLVIIGAMQCLELLLNHLELLGLGWLMLLADKSFDRFFSPSTKVGSQTVLVYFTLAAAFAAWTVPQTLHYLYVFWRECWNSYPPLLFYRLFFWGKSDHSPFLGGFFKTPIQLPPYLWISRYAARLARWCLQVAVIGVKAVLTRLRNHLGGVAGLLLLARLAFDVVKLIRAVLGRASARGTAASGNDADVASNPFMFSGEGDADQGPPPSASSPVCAICMDAIAAFRLGPCGHLCLCRGCRPKLAAAGHTSCPVCRRNVRRVQRVYF